MTRLTFQHSSTNLVTAMRAFFAGLLLTVGCPAQSTFDVASIHPSSGEVKFERNGRTEVAGGKLQMRDVTVSTCIQWAYGVPGVLVEGPASLREVHYDIIAKASPETTQEQMRGMLRELLLERFGLQFHGAKKEMRVYELVTTARAGVRLHLSEAPGDPFHENSATGMVARSLSMSELAAYLSDPMNAPLVDKTGLPGRYDFTINFVPYVDMNQPDVRPDPVAVIRAALRGELGLDLQQRKETVDVMVVDRVEPPSLN